MERWPDWVDGLDRVIQIAGDWPQLGASVEWVSGPAGRGRVVERVIGYEPLAGQSLEVQDDSIDGRQQVTFMPDETSVEVQLSLDYSIRQRSIFTPLRRLPVHPPGDDELADEHARALRRGAGGGAGGRGALTAESTI